MDQFIWVSGLMGFKMDLGKLNFWDNVNKEFLSIMYIKEQHNNIKFLYNLKILILKYNK